MQNRFFQEIIKAAGSAESNNNISDSATTIAKMMKETLSSTGDHLLKNGRGEYATALPIIFGVILGLVCICSLCKLCAYRPQYDNDFYRPF